MDDILLRVLPGLAVALVGSLLSYRFALASAKRNEYNALADKLFLAVDRKLVDSSAGSFSLSGSDVKLLMRQMSPFARKKFEQAIADLENAMLKTRLNDLGQVFFVDVNEVNQKLSSVAKLLARK